MGRYTARECELARRSNRQAELEDTEAGADHAVDLGGLHVRWRIEDLRLPPLRKEQPHPRRCAVCPSDRHDLRSVRSHDTAEFFHRNLADDRLLRWVEENEHLLDQRKHRPVTASSTSG